MMTLMQTPTRSLEHHLRHEGYDAIAGLDEVGRGAWAGPIVAGVVILSPDTVIEGVRDSKKLTPKRREVLYTIIVEQARAWAIGMVTEQEIDAIGINQANCQAMARAIRALSIMPDFLLVDGYVKVPMTIEQQQVVDGDATVHSIACASVLAKVTRDRVMVDLHAQDHRYGYDRHKGYGTAYHQAMLRKYGPSAAHRQSYGPIRRLGALRRG